MSSQPGDQKLKADVPVCEQKDEHRFNVKLRETNYLCFCNQLLIEW